MSKLFYNFCIGDKNKGYHYLEHLKESLLSETRFFLETGELYINTFNLKLEADKVTAYKYRDGDWIDFRSRCDTHYPTSAYPLFLSKVVSKPYHYIAISEHNDSTLGETILTRARGEITETRQGKVVRRFTMKDVIPVRIDWGGPVSHLCSDAEEAVKGSGITFNPN